MDPAARIREARSWDPAWLPSLTRCQAHVRCELLTVAHRTCALPCLTVSTLTVCRLLLVVWPAALLSPLTRPLPAFCRLLRSDSSLASTTRSAHRKLIEDASELERALQAKQRATSNSLLRLLDLITHEQEQREALAGQIIAGGEEVVEASCCAADCCIVTLANMLGKPTGCSSTITGRHSITGGEEAVRGLPSAVVLRVACKRKHLRRCPSGVLALQTTFTSCWCTASCSKWGTGLVGCAVQQ